MQRTVYVVGYDKDDAVRRAENYTGGFYWKRGVAEMIAKNTQMVVFSVPVTIDLADISDLD